MRGLRAVTEMTDTLFGDINCRKNCRYVAFYQEKADKADEFYRKKSEAYNKVLYANTDLRKINSSLTKERDELSKQLKAALKNIEDVSKYKTRTENLERENHELKAEKKKHEKQEELIKKQKDEIEALTNEKKKLEIRLNMNSTNSSKPSSTDTPEHKKIQNSRKKTGRKPGGQPGHEGHKRNIPQAKNVINEEILLEPDKKTIEEGITYTGREKRRTVSDIEVVVRNKIYISREYVDSHGEKHWVDFPENISHNELSYGSELKAFLYFLLNKCNVSNENARNFVTELTGGALKPSGGFVQGLMKEFGTKSKKEADEIFNELVSSPYLHTDFTNVFLNGKNKQVLVCSNGETVLYLYRNNKGHKGIADSPVQGYTGILIHDHDITFYTYGSKHQECLVHELRYLAEIMLYEKNLTWAGKMKEFYNKLFALTDEQIAALTEEEIQKYKDEFLSILAIGEKEYEKNPPKDYFRKGYCLCKKMKEYVESELRFLSTPGLPRQNNCVERFGRKVKRKMRAMTTFRSEESAKQICQGLSTIYTASANGENIFEKIVEIFDRPSPPPATAVDDTSPSDAGSDDGADSKPEAATAPAQEEASVV